MAEFPPASNGHGWIEVDGMLEALWCADEKEDILPTAMVDVLEDLQDDDDDDVDTYFYSFFF